MKFIATGPPKEWVIEARRTAGNCGVTELKAAAIRKRALTGQRATSSEAIVSGSLDDALSGRSGAG